MPPITAIYEQPLNEHIRFCLRLEYLFQKVKHYLHDETCWGARTTLEAILEILNVVDRPDLKTKLSKALNLYINNLTQLTHGQFSADLDERKLRRILEQLKKLTANLNLGVGKIGQSLKENEFLAAISQRATTAGCTCAFNTPAYHLWSQLSAKTRQQNLEDWLANFTELKTIVTLLLKLTRESALLKPEQAKEGFYQINLDPKLPYQMVRLALPINEQIYPEISVGRYRLSVHFYILNTFGRPQQVKQNVDFALACCKI